jgi:Peptidase family C25
MFERARRSLPLLLLAALTVAEVRAEPVPMVKILVDRDGVVRVTDTDLAQAGFKVQDAEIERLRLSLRGQEVPVLLERPAAGPDRFEISFYGRFPRGKRAWEDEYTKTSVYVLGIAPAGGAPARLVLEQAPRPPAQLPRHDESMYLAHFEVNRRLIRFTGRDLPDDNWYWEELKATDQEPTRLKIAVDRVGKQSRVFHLRLHFMGYSTIAANPDHFVMVKWNGQYLGDAVWDGQTTLLYWPTLDASLLKEGENELSLQIRPVEATGAIDLALLDWVEVGYSRLNRLDAGGQEPVAAGNGSATAISAADRLLVYDTRQPRVFEVESRGGKALFRGEGLEPGVFETRFQAVKRGTGLPPKAIVVSRPVELQGPGLGADFIIITHSRLRPAAERLAASRRREGLLSVVVDIDDVYDRFQYGFFGPEAIRTFLQYAWNHWSPRPRYVLLMGDASWDYKNGTVADEYYADWHWSMGTGATLVWKNSSTPYEPGEVANDRQLVPTMQWQSPFGHAASDNYFAAVNGFNDLPDIAVGRFPVVSLEEAEAIVDKTLEATREAAHPAPGALFITDDIVYHQKQADKLVEDAEKAGWSPTRIYPKAEDKDNARHSRAIIDAFDAGQSLVVFAGHGGRYIWRTGPPDLKKNHDLFTLAHLDQLKPGAQLPVVISLTCYSAPFDHPTADSIGEKLLRLPRKGAAAIIASSWRNQAPFALGDQLILDLGTPEYPRLGDAFVAAQRMPQQRGTRNSYNLLGDPTLPFVRPSPPPGVSVATQGGSVASTSKARKD